MNPATAYGLDTGVTDPRLFGFPRINTGSHDFNYLGGNSSWPLWTIPSHTSNISDTLTWTHGKHSLKVGGIYSFGGVDYLRATEGRGEVNFRFLEDFIAGTPVHDWAIQYGNPERNVNLKAFGLFAQDDYRVTRNITVNLGLRYDVTYPISEDKDLLANFNTTQGIVQVGHGINQPYNTNHNNISPRIGVAWDIFGNGKTVLRSGFGIIFVQPSIRTFMFGGGGLNLNPSGVTKIIGNADGTTTTLPGTGTLNTFFVSGASPDLINWSDNGQTIFPSANQVTATSCAGPTTTAPGDPFSISSTPCTIFAVDQHLNTPYVMNWNLNLQQQLSPNTVLQVAYVANRGVQLYSITDPNQANPAQVVNSPLYEPGDFDGTNIIAEQLARPYTTNCPTTVLGGLGTGGPCFPYVGFVNLLSNQSSSSYQSLQVTLTKRYSKGLYLLAGYTYAHAIDTNGETSNLADVPQNSLNFAGEKASSDYDIRHRVTLSATYEIPSRRSWAQMLEGWQLTALVTLQGGYPVSFYDDGNDFTATGEGELNAGNDRWNILGSPGKVQFKNGQPLNFVDSDNPL